MRRHPLRLRRKEVTALSATRDRYADLIDRLGR